MKKVLLAVGGSGGHVLPAEQLKTLLGAQADVVMAGSGLAKNPFLQKETKFRDITAGPWGTFRFLTQSCKGFFQALLLFYRFRPDVVVGFGSYHTFPVLAAAFFLRKKIYLFEANCTLGKVNRLFLPVAQTLATQFVQKLPIAKSTLVSPLPWGIKKAASKKEAFAYFGLNSDKTTILVFGGSQGASFLNERIPRALNYFTNIQVIHFTGKGNTVVYSCPASVKEFEPRMDLAYIAADLVIARSGAGTIAELLHYQKPALLIPFPQSTENHQVENGRFFESVVGGGLMLEQSFATLEKIGLAITTLLGALPDKQRALQQWGSEKRVHFADLILQNE